MQPNNNKIYFLVSILKTVCFLIGDLQIKYHTHKGEKIMSNYFCINKSGLKIPVYTDTKKTKQIGTLYDREAFGYDCNWGGDDYFCRIEFRNSAGKLSGGYIIDPPAKAITLCSDYPYGTVKIGKETFLTFLMRKSCSVYKARGGSWGNVAANCRVACRTALSGDSNPTWKGINYVENTKGVWIPVTGDDVSYGFVDTSLASASGHSSVAMYGSW